MCASLHSLSSVLASSHNGSDMSTRSAEASAASLEISEATGLDRLQQTTYAAARSRGDRDFFGQGNKLLFQRTRADCQGSECRGLMLRQTRQTTNGIVGLIRLGARVRRSFQQYGANPTETNRLQSPASFAAFDFVKRCALAGTYLVAEFNSTLAAGLRGWRGAGGSGISSCRCTSSSRAICSDGIRVNAVNHDAPIFNWA